MAPVHRHADITLLLLLLPLLLQDRLTMLPFLLSFVDYDASPEVYERYAR
jgi:hypothetical protein